MSIQNDDAPMEVLAPSAIESLERAQVDVQVATAHRYPRSIAIFRKRAMDMVSQDIETAESCIYSRPVGNGKVVEGESIRMAEIVAACYGNLRFGARIIEQTERYVKCEGVAHDLESNVAGKSEAMESTVKRDGTPYDERMRIVVAKACLSKALRDSIFRVVPKGLCKSISDAAKGVISKQTKTLEQRRTMAKQWLTQIKVDDARAFNVLNVKGWSEVGEDQLIILTGLKTALKDSEISLVEAFPNVTAANTGPVAPAPQPKEATKPAAALTPATTQPVASDDGDLCPKTSSATERAQTTTAAVAAVTAENHPTCRHCNTVVEDMASHNCPQMQAKAAELQQEAAKKSVASATAKTDTDSPTEILESVKFLAAEASLTDAHVLEFCKRNKIAKPEQTSLSQLADSKLKLLIKSWPNILPELVAIRDGK